MILRRFFTLFIVFSLILSATTYSIKSVITSLEHSKTSSESTQKAIQPQASFLLKIKGNGILKSNLLVKLILGK